MLDVQAHRIHTHAHAHIPPSKLNYTAGISSNTKMFLVNYIMSAKNRNALILVNRRNRSHSAVYRSIGPPIKMPKRKMFKHINSHQMNTSDITQKQKTKLSRTKRNKTKRLLAIKLFARLSFRFIIINDLSSTSQTTFHASMGFAMHSCCYFSSSSLLWGFIYFFFLLLRRLLTLFILHEVNFVVVKLGTNKWRPFGTLSMLCAHGFDQPHTAVKPL